MISCGFFTVSSSVIPLGIEVRGVDQTAIAKRDTLIFGFFEPVCIFPVRRVVNATTGQLSRNIISQLAEQGWFHRRSSIFSK